MKAFRILAALSLALTLAPAVVSAATADGADLRLPASLGTPPQADNLNPEEHKRIDRQVHAEWQRRTDAYVSWFTRKFGHSPDARQIHEWYRQSYGVVPS